MGDPKASTAHLPLTSARPQGEAQCAFDALTVARVFIDDAHVGVPGGPVHLVHPARGGGEGAGSWWSTASFPAPQATPVDQDGETQLARGGAEGLAFWTPPLKMSSLTTLWDPGTL